MKEEESEREIDTRAFNKLEIEKQSFYANWKKEEIAILWGRQMCSMHACDWDNKHTFEMHTISKQMQINMSTRERAHTLTHSYGQLN